MDWNLKYAVILKKGWRQACTNPYVNRDFPLFVIAFLFLPSWAVYSPASFTVPGETHYISLICSS